MAERGTVLKFNSVSLPDRAIDVAARKLAYGDLFGEGFAGKKLRALRCMASCLVWREGLVR